MTQRTAPTAEQEAAYKAQLAEQRAYYRTADARDAARDATVRALILAHVTMFGPCTLRQILAPMSGKPGSVTDIQEAREPEYVFRMLTAMTTDGLLERDDRRARATRYFVPARP